MRKLIFALALGAILIPNHGFTLGLGEIEVNSSLNQQLEARIDLLSASPDDAETLIVKLASREEFVRAGLDRPLVLSSLKFKALVEDGHVYINVLSPKPIREPFLNFLVEVDWPKGHLIREYTILLDPPVFMGAQGSQKAAAVSGRPAMQEAAKRAPQAVQSISTAAEFRPDAPSPAAPVVVAAEVAAPAQVQQQVSYTAPAYAPPAGHRVQSGDTAWSIANGMRPDSSVSTEQMLIAMLRANPEVFINENVNGLKRGYILRTPDYADINAISHEEAKATVRQQNALWREYQQSLSSDQPASAIEESYEETEYSSAVEADADSRLSIVSAGGGSSASGEMKDPSEMTVGELREQLALTRERVETERVEKEELQGQIDSLATQVDEMKGLLIIEDDVMAEVQSVDDLSNEEILADENLTDEATLELDDEERALDALDELTGDSITEEGLEADAEELFVDEADLAEQVQEADVVAEQDTFDEAESDYIPPQETNLVDMLLNNRMVLAGVLLVLLVIGAIVYLIKRRRSNASADSAAAAIRVEKEVAAVSEETALEDVADMIDDESLDDLVSDEEVEASMAEAESLEEEFDAEATMILPSETDAVVTPAADLKPEEDEQDDVMAEADVYLAYGIYQQAEELLENAIKENPEKDNYRVKLAETYFAGKNAEALVKLGTEMKQAMGDEETPAWTKVAAIGKELCPDEEIFQQAELAADLDVNDLMPKLPEPMDFDLGDSASELDLDFDEQLEELDSADLELPSIDMDETAIISADDSTETLNELEFDLSETDAIEETPVEESKEEEEFSLDISASELDLDVGSVATDERSEEDAESDIDFDLSVASDEVAETDDSGIDPDLDMSMEDAGEGEEIDLSGEAADIDLDLDMSMDDVEEAGVIDLSGEAADIDLDLDMSMDDAEEAGEVDLSDEAADLDVDLDLSMDDIATTEETSEESVDLDLSADAAELDMSMDDDFADMDLSEPVDVDEVNTKLDLAKAYLDMGDNEGARDILDEVIAAGNEDQKKEAEELIAQAS